MLKLTKIETPFTNKLVEVILVSKNKFFMFIIFKVILLGFINLNNGQKFNIIIFIISFYRNNFCKNICYLMLLV